MLLFIESSSCFGLCHSPGYNERTVFREFRDRTGRYHRRRPGL